MRAEALREAWRAMPLASPATLTRGRPFIVLSPHPDDESLGTGGLIAAACEAGQGVEVVVLTDGSASHPRSKTHPRAALVALRQAEASEACRRLGLAANHLHHVGLPDAEAPTEGPVFDAAVDRLGRLMEDSGAASLFVTWGHDPHCDHEAADALARALRHRRPEVTLWSYPIWGWHLPADTEVEAPAPQGFRIDITPWLAAKHAAIAAHASQMTGLITDDPEGFRFDDASVAPFMGPYEYVFEVPA